MPYHIDLSAIKIDTYAKKLQSAYLPPSRMILRENTFSIFEIFKSEGIENVQVLLQNLKMKPRFKELSELEGLSHAYLTILLREIKSMHPTPNKISDFEGISDSTKSKLQASGIKNTKQLYDKVLTPEQRTILCHETGIEESDLLILTKLTDLSRIKWVGSTFARMLFDLGVDCIKKATTVDPIWLHEQINRINQERNYYKGKIGLNDMKIFVQEASKTEQEIQF